MSVILHCLFVWSLFLIHLFLFMLLFPGHNWAEMTEISWQDIQTEHFLYTGTDRGRRDFWRSQPKCKMLTTGEVMVADTFEEDFLYFPIRIFSSILTNIKRNPSWSLSFPSSTFLRHVRYLVLCFKREVSKRSYFFNWILVPPDFPKLLLCSAKYPESMDLNGCKDPRSPSWCIFSVYFTHLKARTVLGWRPVVSAITRNDWDSWEKPVFSCLFLAQTQLYLPASIVTD